MLARAFIRARHCFEQVRSGGTDPRFCARDVHLHRWTFGERARTSRWPLGARQPCELVDRSAGEAERHRAHTRGQQAEDRELVERAALPGTIGQKRNGALPWNEQVLDLDVVAPGATKPDHPPRVMNVGFGSREDQHSRVRDPVFERTRDAIFFDEAPPHQPRTMLATTREGPAARHAIASGHHDGSAVGSEDSAGHRLGRAGEDLLRRRPVEPSCDEPARRPDHHAPRRSRVPDRELLDHTDECCWMRLFAPERPGDTQRKKTCRREFRDNFEGQTSLTLDPGREGAKARDQGSCGVDRIVCDRGGRAHSRASRWSSGITSFAKRRALRSASWAGMPA